MHFTLYLNCGDDELPGTFHFSCIPDQAWAADENGNRVRQSLWYDNYWVANIVVTGGRLQDMDGSCLGLLKWCRGDGKTC